MRKSSLAGLSIAAFMITTSGAHAALVAGSTAAAVGATLTIGGQTNTMPLQVEATGAAPPAYDKKVTQRSLSDSLGLFGGLTFSAGAKTLTSTAVSKGVVGGSIASAALSSIGSVDVTIAGAPLGTVLKITSGKVTASASYSKGSAASSTTGKATIESLVIDAPFLGIKNVKFSGTPKPNQILYQNAAKTLTVYLNAQRATTSGGTAKGLAVEAIDFHAANYSVDGVSVSGDIAVGIATAGQ